MRAEAERLVCEAVRRTLRSIPGQQGTPEGTDLPEGQGPPEGTEEQGAPGQLGTPEGTDLPEGQGTPEGRGFPEGQGDSRQRATSLAITAA